MTTQHPLVELFNRADINSFPSLASVVSELLSDGLRDRFAQQTKAAPRRGMYREYFVGHTGETTSGDATNRREEHLAIALWLAFHEDGFVLPDGARLFPVDYQMPLKSHRDASNAGIGKVDLFCVDESSQPWVAELKVHPLGRGRAETPLKALLEALAYSAIVDADIRYLSRESFDKLRTLKRGVATSRPNLIVLAPTEYWRICDEYQLYHPWRESVLSLGRHIDDTLGIQTRFVGMRHCCWKAPGLNKNELNKNGLNKKPRLLGLPEFHWALANG